MAVSLADIQGAGVVGAGGAGFPTHVKLAAQVDTVIVNAAECEPLLHKDKEILRTYGQKVLDGLAAAMRLTGAERGIVGIKEKYSEIIEALKPKLTSLMSIVPLQDVYPAGDEFILVYNVLDRIVPPGGIPLDVGVVTINVETALNIAAASGRPVTDKFLTVGGAVAQPVTLRVPIGISLEECLSAAGGATVDNPCYIVGGVMMGRLEDDCTALVDKTTGGVIVLGSDHVLIRRRRREWKQQAAIGRSACDQCSFCTELCPRYLLGHPIEPHRTMRSLAFSLTGEANVMGTTFCCECNLCSLYSCPEDLDPKDVCAQNKRRWVEKKEQWRKAPLNGERAKWLMDGRKAPMGRLMRKLDLMNFNNVGPIKDTPLPTHKVGIKLSQHVGAACEAAVKVGQSVAVGELVGAVPKGNGKPVLGAAVHASISGRVSRIEDEIVWIEKG